MHEALEDRAGNIRNYVNVNNSHEKIKMELEILTIRISVATRNRQIHQFGQFMNADRKFYKLSITASWF